MTSRLLILSALLCSSPSFAFSSFAGSRAASRFTKVQRPIEPSLLHVRGGQQNEEIATLSEGQIVDATTIEADPNLIEKILEPVSTKSPLFAGAMAPVASTLASFGASYGASLQARPIVTKSVTAGFIFALSDFLAQRWETTEGEKKINKTRMVVSALVGLLYFGPAAHGRVIPNVGILHGS